MKDETKEILDKFDKVLENYKLDKKFGQMSVDSICHLFPYEMIVIKDYITNLQEEIKRQEKAQVILDNQNAELYNKLTNLQEIEKDHQKLNGKLREENQNLKERCEYLQRSCERKEEQMLDYRQEYMEQEDYKSRIDKAKEYIKEKIKNICFENDRLIEVYQILDKGE